MLFNAVIVFLRIGSSFFMHLGIIRDQVFIIIHQNPETGPLQVLELTRLDRPDKKYHPNNGQYGGQWNQQVKNRHSLIFSQT